MNMNRIAKLSAAVTLGLSLMGASLAADAASASSTAAQSQSGGSSQVTRKVIHLKPIVVTRADEAGQPKPKHTVYGRTAYLGTVTVTAADSQEARAAEQGAQQKGTMYLGDVVVTPKDSDEARYAAAQAAIQPGTLYLGTVEVTGRDTKPAFVGKAVMAMRRLSHNAMVSMISALAFVRVGG